MNNLRMPEWIASHWITSESRKRRAHVSFPPQQVRTLGDPDTLSHTQSQHPISLSRAAEKLQEWPWNKLHVCYNPRSRCSFSSPLALVSGVHGQRTSLVRHENERVIPVQTIVYFCPGVPDCLPNKLLPPSSLSAPQPEVIGLCDANKVIFKRRQLTQAVSSILFGGFDQIASRYLVKSISIMNVFFSNPPFFPPNASNKCRINLNLKFGWTNIFSNIFFDLLKMTLFKTCIMLNMIK